MRETRRGIFGWIVGALALAGGIRGDAYAGIPAAAERIVIDDPIILGTPMSEEQIGELVRLWGQYQLSPTMIICSPGAAADARAVLEMAGKPDLFGIRRRRLADRYRRDYEARIDMDLEGLS